MNEKKKTIRRLSPVGPMEMEAISSWLTDMAAQGWHLCGTGSIIRTFEFYRGEPRNVRYRLEPSTGEPDYPATVMFKEMGWEPVMRHGEFYIFRSLSSDAPELSTDHAVQLSSMQKMCRKHTLWSLLLLAMIPIVILSQFEEGYRFLVTFGAAASLSFIGMYVLLGIDALVQMIQAWALVCKMKQGTPLDYQKDWKKPGWNHRFYTVSLHILLVVVLVAFLVQGIIGFSRIDHEKWEQAGEQPFVTIRDLCPEGTYTPEQFGSYCSITEYVSDCAPKNVEWMEYAQLETPEGEKWKGGLIVHYHETAGPWLARGLAEEYLRLALEEQYNKSMEMPELDVDFAAGYTMSGAPTIILQKGNIVLTACVTVKDGEEYLWELWMKKMLEILPN